MATQSQLSAIETEASAAIHALAEQRIALCADEIEELRAFRGMLWALFRLMVARRLRAGNGLALAGKQVMYAFIASAREFRLASDPDAKPGDAMEDR